MIRVKKLTFSYSKTPFIADCSFEVKKGEIFGFLGPSGAGKSTIQKILTGIIKNYKGDVYVNNQDMKKISSVFYQSIGVDFEFSTLFEKFSAIENLVAFGSLYKKKYLDNEKLLDLVGLLNHKDKKVSEFSKGMKSRLNFIKSIIHDPDIIFLDEPMTGLDPTNTKIMKEIILSLKKLGKTIIITTHNMYDATELCDRVAFIVNGSIKALDSPHNLIMSKGASVIKYSYLENGKEVFKEALLSSTNTDQILINLIKENKLLSIHSSEPTLEDIFREITGCELK